MAVTSVLDIDVNDEKFTRFKSLFDQYQSALAKLPGAWGATDKAVGGTAEAFAGMSAALMAQNELLHRGAGEHDKMRKTAASTDRTMRSLAKSTKDVASHIRDATTSLLKWTALTSVFSGVLGAGGLFGIDRLAGSVAAGRRSAQGLGVSVGEQRAFGLNYSRFVDPTSLGNIADAQTDANKAWIFTALGVDPRGKDAAEIAVEAAPKAKAIYDRAPPGQEQQVAEANGLLSIFSMADLRRLHTATMADLNKAASGYGRDRKALGLDDETQRKWLELNTQLDRAGQSIENVFVRDLTPLAPALGHLSESVTKAIDAFLSNPHLKEWIGDFGTVIDHWATYLGSPAVKSDIDAFVNGVANMATAVGRAVTWFEKLFPAGNGSLVPGAPGGNVQSNGDPTSWFTRLFPGLVSGPGSQRGGTRGDRNNNPTNLMFANQPGATNAGGFAAFPTVEAGAAADLNQYLLYQQRDHLTSIEDMVLKATPRDQNPGVDAYIDKLAKRLGLKRTDSVDLTNIDWATQFLLAVSEQEGTHPDIGAVKRGVVSRLTGAPLPTPPVPPTPGFQDPRALSAFNVAESYIGANTTEVNGFLSANGDSLDAAKNAWCAAFVNASLKSVGISGSGSDVATSFERWGRETGFDDVKQGDVLVEARGHKPGETGGHVGFATGKTRVGKNGQLQIQMLSGNTNGGQVAYTWEDANGVDIRRAIQAHNDAAPAPTDRSATVDQPDTPGNAPRPVGQGVAIHIYNQTGGSAATTAAQLAQ